MYISDFWLNCDKENIKKEYENGIKRTLLQKSSNLYNNPHTVPKIKKIQINRGLGLSAQNSNILKKWLQNFTSITI